MAKVDKFPKLVTSCIDPYASSTSKSVIPFSQSIERGRLKFEDYLGS